MSDQIDKLMMANWLNGACSDFCAGFADGEWPLVQKYLRAVRDHVKELTHANAVAETRLVNAREFIRLRWRHLQDCPEKGSHPGAVDLAKCNCGLKVALADLGDESVLPRHHS